MSMTINVYQVDDEGVREETPTLVLETEKRSNARAMALLAEENPTIEVEVERPVATKTVKFKGIGD